MLKQNRQIVSLNLQKYVASRRRRLFLLGRPGTEIHNVTYFYYYNASDYIMSTIMEFSAALGERMSEKNYNF